MIYGGGIDKMGNLIVFEGLDGSGKSTQVCKLVNRLSEEGNKVKNLHFPREGVISEFGKMIEDYLDGGYEGIDNPYFIASLYANDRYMTKEVLEDWIEKYDYVILDRYVYSALAFQGARFTDNEERGFLMSERDRFLDWLFNYEFSQNKMPEPDIIFVVDLSIELIEKSLEEKDKDIHENDLEYLREVREVYDELLGMIDGMCRIKAYDKNGRYSEDVLFHKIYQKIEERIL